MSVGKNSKLQKLKKWYDMTRQNFSDFQLIKYFTL